MGRRYNDHILPVGGGTIWCQRMVFGWYRPTDNRSLYVLPRGPSPLTPTLWKGGGYHAAVTS